MKIQKEKLAQAFNTHIKDCLQSDDILWIGIKLYFLGFIRILLESLIKCGKEFVLLFAKIYT